MKLDACLAAVEDIDAARREEMFFLMDRHYANVSRARFDADLDEKRWVILLSDRCGAGLRGFSTQTLLETTVDGRPITALFSGDTIIDQDHWGDQALPHVWGRLALSLIDSLPGRELYWFLISKGYKTYRFLPVFFHEFYPRCDSPTPPEIAAVIDALGRLRFPEEYDGAAGLVRAGLDQYCLRAGVAPVTAERLRDPHVRFFEERNPGHVHGDELCCLAPLTRANFTRAAYRVIGPEAALVEAP